VISWRSIFTASSARLNPRECLRGAGEFSHVSRALERTNTVGSVHCHAYAREEACGEIREMTTLGMK